LAISVSPGAAHGQFAFCERPACRWLVHAEIVGVGLDIAGQKQSGQVRIAVLGVALYQFLSEGTSGGRIRSLEWKKLRPDSGRYC
jgi:hypothetical protein